MQYTKLDRRAINELAEMSRKQFDTLESFEKGEFAIPELAKALMANPSLIAFSCLTGNGAKEEIEMSLGGFFTKRKILQTEEILSKTGIDNVLVILDDCEPSRVWQWRMPQVDTSSWCQMMIEDQASSLPSWCKVTLWSKIEARAVTSMSLNEALDAGRSEKYALIVHQCLKHMVQFPNKKLIGDLREAAIRRVAAYATQGLVLEEVLPNAILLQTETPWSVKDPLYQSLRTKKLPIIHPFEERK